MRNDASSAAGSSDSGGGASAPNTARLKVPTTKYQIPIKLGIPDSQMARNPAGFAPQPALVFCALNLPEACNLELGAFIGSRLPTCPRVQQSRVPLPRSAAGISPSPTGTSECSGCDNRGCWAD